MRIFTRSASLICRARAAIRVNTSCGSAPDSRLAEAQREGWSVLVQGPAHHISPDELPEVTGSSVTPWAGGERHLYVRITPVQVTGRRIHNF